MNNLSEKFEAYFEKISPLFSAIASNTFLQGLSGGMMATLPITVLGSFALLLCVVPLGGFTTFLQTSGIASILMNVYTYTMGLLAVYMVIFIAKNLAGQLVEKDDGMTAAAIAFVSFLIVTPMGALEDGSSAIATTWTGAQGAFTAIIVASVSAYIYAFFVNHQLTIKMPDGVPPVVVKVFAGLVPFIVIPVLFMAVNYIFSLTAAGSFHQMIYSLLQAPLMNIGGNLWACMLVALLAQVLWFFGIHGQNVLSPFYSPLWLTLDAANLAAISAGTQAPNIVGSAFYSIFCFGGYQIALCLLLLRCRSEQFKQFGRFGIGPAIFGIGEPLNFGMPLILNFKFIFPFLTNGVFMLAVAYAAIASGLVPHLNGTAVIFGLPFGVQAFMEGGWRVLALAVVVNVILPYFLWMPWVKMADKEAYAAEQAAAQEESSVVIETAGEQI